MLPLSSLPTLPLSPSSAPPHRLRSLLLTCAFALSLSSVAAPEVAASEAQRDVEVQMVQRVPVGKQPSVLIIVNKPVSKVRMTLRSKGTTVEEKHGLAKRGTKVRFKLPHKKPGDMSWRGRIDVTFTDGSTGNMPVTFTTQVVGDLNFTPAFTVEDVRDHHRIKITADRPVAAIDVEVHGVEGDLLANTSKEFLGAKPGELLEVDWMPAKDQAPYRVRIVVHDVNGFFRSMESYVFEYPVPHDDPEFATGSAAITPDEEKKLTAALDALQKVVARTQKAAKVTGSPQNLAKLYIIGHTDTVGSASSNRALSQRRAVAIAQWFAKHGVRMPIYAAGVGEDMPKVATRDETPEPQNRFVEYLVSNTFPHGIAAKKFKRIR